MQNYHTTVVNIFVKEQFLQEFKDATLFNQQSSVKEEANLRFDLLNSPEDNCHFILYEMYKDKDGAKAHKQTQHYLKWKEDVADMMAKPREGVPFIGLSI
ncbi:MAG: antibiotic biosynthesis monooxygenase [Sulfurimonas sp.]|nr:antibiotic biosynthesis monooxygenase [Sulfurimonas sp.]